MKIQKKGRLAQAFCRHRWTSGQLASSEVGVFTTICEKCGKIKGDKGFFGRFLIFLVGGYILYILFA